MVTKSDRNYVLITIHHTGAVTKVVQKHEPKLNQLQKIVGGYVEQIQRFTYLTMSDKGKMFAYSRGRLFANEEGKLPQFTLQVNIYATEVWKEQSAYADQVLVGDVVFVARTNEPVTGGLNECADDNGSDGSTGPQRSHDSDLGPT